MITCSKKITFEAAHRIIGHEGHCKYLHGHGYVCEFTVTSPKLDKLGRVIDLSVVKDVMGKWLKDNFDHNVILWDKDRELISAIEKCIEQKVYKLSSNPTVENLANHLLNEICPQLFKNYDVTCIEVKIAETDNNSGCAKL